MNSVHPFQATLFLSNMGFNIVYSEIISPMRMLWEFQSIAPRENNLKVTVPLWGSYIWNIKVKNKCPNNHGGV
jgi:hypothetical protein